MPATKQQPKPPQPSPTAVPQQSAFAKKAHKTSKVVVWARATRKFLIERGEKLVFAGCVVGSLVFSAIGFTHLPYSKSPEALKAETSKILNELESGKSVGSLTKKLPKAPDVNKLKMLAGKNIPARAYEIGPLRIPYQSRDVRRGEPKILPVEGLLASAGYGPIALQGAGPATSPARPAVAAEKLADAAKDVEERRKKLLEEKKARARRNPIKTPAKNPQEEKKPATEVVATPPGPKEKPLLAQAPASSHVELRNWVCLVGAIPYAEQQNEYQQAFHEALFQSAERDQPHFALPRIERAEIVGKQRLRWRPVNVIGALEDHANWAAEYPESADPRLVDPDLTEQLPPLVSVNYDQAHVNHPQVKVVVVKPTSAAVAKSSSPSKTASDHAKEKKPPQPIMGLRDKKPAAKQTPAEKAASAKTSDGEATETDVASPPVEIIRYRLFRFFDFDVLPGKAYCYRVKLTAINPNYDLPARFLAQPARAEELFLDGGWSAPSPPVTVTEGTRLLAGGVALGVRRNGEEEAAGAEPMAQVLVHYYDYATAKRANVLIEAARGARLEAVGVPVAVEREAPAPSKKARPGKTPDAEPETSLNVETGTVVVDLFGGDAIPAARDRVIPGHVLVIDRHGNYRTITQAEDAPVFGADLPSAQSPAAVEQARN